MFGGPSKGALLSWIARSCLIAAVSLLCLLPLSAAQAKRVALVVGVSDYQFSPRLPNPGNDAAGISTALKDAGFDVVTSLDEDLSALLQTLDKFYAKAVDSEAAVFFFAGHGLQFNGVNYLVPRDAQLKSEARVRQEAIALQDIISAIEKRSKITLVFLDACRDNPLAEQLQRSVVGRDRSAAVPRGLAPMKGNPDTLLVFAAAPGRTASDGAGRNSPFTAALLSNMREPGVEIELMMKRVTRDVHQATKGQQTPERLSKLTSEFAFHPKAPLSDRPDPAADSEPVIKSIESSSAIVRNRICPPAEESTEMEVAWLNSEYFEAHRLRVGMDAFGFLTSTGVAHSTSRSERITLAKRQALEMSAAAARTQGEPKAAFVSGKIVSLSIQDRSATESEVSLRFQLGSAATCSR